MADIDLHATRLWLKWAEQFSGDSLENYTDKNITAILPLYEVRVAGHYGVDETHHAIRLYVDDELGYIELFFIDRAGQIDLLLVQADADWLCIRAVNHTKES